MKQADAFISEIEEWLWGQDSTVDKTRERKLKHYSKRTPKQFIQLDGHYLGPDGGDDMMVPDTDGDCLLAGQTVELMHFSGTRVLIDSNFDPKVAARMLRKAAEWLDRQPELLSREYWASFMDSVY